MPGEAEAGDVGQRVDLVPQRRLARRLVERGRHRQHLALEVGGRVLPGAVRVEDHAVAERLGQHERVAGARADVGEDTIGVHHAGDREAVLRLGVLDRVPAGEAGARLGHLLGAAAQHVAQQAEVQLLHGEVHEVERDHGPPAHRPDVRERVGGGDAPEPDRVVDDRRDVVDRRDHGDLRAEAVDRRVVGGVEADEQVRVRGARQPAEHLRQHGRSELRRSAAGARDPHQGLLLQERQHGDPPRGVPLTPARRSAGAGGADAPPRCGSWRGRSARTARQS